MKCPNIKKSMTFLNDSKNKKNIKRYFTEEEIQSMLNEEFEDVEIENKNNKRNKSSIIYLTTETLGECIKSDCNAWSKELNKCLHFGIRR